MKVGLVTVAVAAALSPTAAADARTLHVSPAGDDAGPGTAALPFLTIQRGVDIARAGDTVLVHEGTYRAESFPLVDIDRGGARGRPLTVAAAPDETPLLAGTEEHRYGIRLAPGVSDVVIAGLAFAGFAGDAVQLDCRRCGEVPEHRRIVLRGLEVSGSGTAIRVTSGSKVTVRDSWLHDNSEVGIDCAPGPCVDLVVRGTRLERHTGYDWSDGLAVESGRRIRVVDSVARSNAGDGFDSKAPATGVLRSQAHDNARDGIKLWRGGSVLADSISAGNGLAGVVLVSGGTFTVGGSLVAGNGRVARAYGLEVGYGEREETACALFDTIFASNNGAALYIGPAVAVVREDHDLFWTGSPGNAAIDLAGRAFEQDDVASGAWAAATGLGAGTIAARPLFAGSDDYRLLEASPGVDGGTAAGASALALDRTRRPQGAGVDIGPYER